jgi:hypothetical protein
MEPNDCEALMRHPSGGATMVTGAHAPRRECPPACDGACGCEACTRAWFDSGLDELIGASWASVCPRCPTVLPIHGCRQSGSTGWSACWCCCGCAATQPGALERAGWGAFGERHNSTAALRTTGRKTVRRSSAHVRVPTCSRPDAADVARASVYGVRSRRE